MKKLIKILLVLSLAIFITLAAVWFYAINKATDIINSYADKEIEINDLLTVSFKEAKKTGFPYKIAWEIHDLNYRIGYSYNKHESLSNYKSPLIIGYNLLTQKLFFEYSGDIEIDTNLEKNAYKFNSKVGYLYTDAKFPLSWDLVKTIKDMESPFELINYVGKISYITKNNQLFDLNRNRNIKLMDFEFSKLDFSFVASKKYDNLLDLIINPPKFYLINTEFKNRGVDFNFDKVADDTMYNFIGLFSSYVNQKISLKINLNDGLNIDLSNTYDSKYLSTKNHKLNFKGKKGVLTLNTNADFKLKKGFFDRAFEVYEIFAEEVRSQNSISKKSLDDFEKISQEIEFIKTHKKDFRLTDLENVDYKLVVKSNLSGDQKKYNGASYVNVDEFSILSNNGGFKIQSAITQRNNFLKAKGYAYLKNYKDFVDFTSPYIYRFGDFKKFNKEAKKLYVKVGKSFLKEISDKPREKNSDIKISYDIDFQHFYRSKIGTLNIAQLYKIYNSTLYTKLLEQVGGKERGDILSKMKKIIPGINENDPTLNNLLPAKKIEKQIKKEIDKVIPKKAKDVIEKTIKNKGDKLLKGLIKN